ncbi:MAG: tripartite tricarboxylate transporter TctB family protein [Pararhodobacter sp.]|nr:tripartite tricarboxylate transporter TctB family protein [Pararhodobacter sp.]
MKLSALNYTHLISGVAGLAIGLFVIWQVQGYPMGTPRRMGAGFFPLMLGILLVTLSLLILAVEGRGIARPDMPRPAWKGLIWVLLSIAAFAALVERAGLVPAIMASVLLSSRADESLTLLASVVLGAACAAIASGLFITALGLPLRMIVL